MAKKTIQEALVYLPNDPLNKGTEQVKIVQRDGVSVVIPIGKVNQRVPLWAAERLKEIGTIDDFEVVE